MVFFLMLFHCHFLMYLIKAVVFSFRSGFNTDVEDFKLDLYMIHVIHDHHFHYPTS